MVRSIKPNRLNKTVPLMSRTEGYCLLQFLNWNSGNLVTSKRILIYLQERKNRGLAPATLRADKNAVICGIRKATIGEENYRVYVDNLRRELNEVFPIKVNLTRVSESQLITIAEMKRIGKFAPGKWKAIAKFLWTTGCRVGDLVQIKLKDCRPIDGNLIEIRVIGKGNRGRDIVIPVELFQEIRQAVGGLIYLFETEKHNKITKSRVGKLMAKLGVKYLGRHIYPHLFRHTFITAQVKAGHDIGAIAEFVGNSPEIIARVYLHSSLKRSIIRSYYEKLTA